MNKKLWIAIVIVFVISVASLIAVIAYKENPLAKGANYNTQVHEQLEAAMGAEDYDAWIQIRKDNNLPMQGKIFQVINAENFDRYVAMHNAMLLGDTEIADSIRTELGLGQGAGSCQGNGGTGCQMHTKNTQTTSTTQVGCQHMQTTSSTSGSCQMAQTGTCPMRG